MATKKRKNDPRSVDGVGRLVIPVEMRSRLGLTEGSEVEFQLDGQRIIIQKYNPGCIFCDRMGDYIVYSGKRVCKYCLDELQQMK